MLFRLSPDYSLVAIAEGGATLGDLLPRLRDAPDIEAVLVPRRADVTLKAVCRQTAQLLTALIEPRPLPQRPADETEEDYRAAVARLVYERVLEVGDRSGVFASGAVAAAALWPAAPSLDESTVVAQVSLAALEYASTLDSRDPLYVSARLYFYNREPLTPAWVRRLGDEAAVRRHLGVDAGPAARALRTGWVEKAAPADNPGWFFWRSSVGHTGSRFKLYVSARCAALPDVLPTAVEVATEHDATGLKVGRTASSLLRPDKLMVYFASRDGMASAAAALSRRIAGAEAQGVPFSSPVDEEGLVSWAVDPPRSERLLAWDGTSWRRWVCDRLAAALVGAAAAEREEGPPPWRIALDRVRLDGVDVSTWAPAGIPWAAAASR